MSKIHAHAKPVQDFVDVLEKRPSLHMKGGEYIASSMITSMEHQ